MRYLVKLEELEEKSNEIINYSQNDICQKIEVLDKLKDNFEWTGEAHDSFITSYDKEITKMKKLNEQMTLFGKFLLSFQNEYSDTQKELDTMMQDFLGDLQSEKR